MCTERARCINDDAVVKYYKALIQQQSLFHVNPEPEGISYVIIDTEFDCKMKFVIETL